MEPTRNRTAPRLLVAVLVWVALLLALWIALTDSGQPIELLVGGLCALAAGALAQAVLRTGGVALRPEPRWALRCARAPWWILRDSALVLGALLAHLTLGRTLAGRMLALRFDPGGESPRDQARRALAYGAGSAGPNSYVVGASREPQAVVVHQLVPSEHVTPLEVVREP
jgi:hypothetical protein